MTMVMLIFLSNDIAVALYLYRNTVSPKESEVDLLVISTLGLERMERRYVRVLSVFAALRRLPVAFVPWGLFDGRKRVGC